MIDPNNHSADNFRTAADFFAAAQAELDAGRDPFDREDMVFWLRDHPEHLDEFASLRAVHIQLVSAAEQSNAGSLAADSIPSRWNSMRRPIWFAAAAALLLVVLPQVLPTFDGVKSNPDLGISAEAQTDTGAQTETETETGTGTGTGTGVEPEAGPQAEVNPTPPTSLITPIATLLSVKQSLEIHRTESNFAAPDPTTGAVILSMNTTIHRTTY